MIALMAVMLVSGVGVALLLGSSIEGMIAANYQMAVQGLYVAEAASQRVVGELGAMDDWAGVAGTLHPTLTDGPPSGARALPDGSTLDLAAVARAAGSSSDLRVWRPYAYGPIRAWVPDTRMELPFYLFVMVAEDSMIPGGPILAAELSPDDSSAPELPQRVLVVRASAFGPRGAVRTVEVKLARGDPGVRILSWAVRR